MQVISVKNGNSGYYNTNFKGRVAQNAEGIIRRLYSVSSGNQSCGETLANLKSFLANSHKDNVFDILIDKNGNLRAIIKNTKLNVKVTPIKSILPMFYKNNPEITNKYAGHINAKADDIIGIYNPGKFLLKLENFTKINFDKDKIDREIYRQSIETLRNNLIEFPKVLSKEQLNMISRRLANFGRQQLQQSGDAGYVYNNIYLCQQYRESVNKRAYRNHKLNVMFGLEEQTLLERLLDNKI